MTDLSEQERDAMEAAIASERFPNARSEQEGVWRAAHEFFVGRGYTPRSMLRLQAAKDGICRICGQPQPGFAAEQQQAKLREELQRYWDYERDIVGAHLAEHPALSNVELAVKASLTLTAVRRARAALAATTEDQATSN